ncbi:multiple inositol polyphosphate phosphatase 1-like [Scleropages formosus]|uniref:Multiple inositol polyphosphate phosphatase 1 n=1 Tax=Scleropages formosus TaxID=113540 RepID=A0A0P7V5E2_SCLFO|nr:multiple inositol polyphosphate phosphatase 1-like [Scleropages formosus]
MRDVLSKSFVLTALSFALARVYSYLAGDAPAAARRIPSIAAYFGTKGRYEEVNPHLIDNILAVNKLLLKPPSADCTAVHLTAIVRHGTRFPTKKNVKKMMELHKLIKAEASSPERWLEDIKNKWAMWYTEDMDGQIVDKGRDDHKHLAVRLANYFPSLLSEENLRNNRVKFITSSKHRCVESVIAFQQGLFTHHGIKDVDFSHEVKDDLMRFFDHCRRFVEDVENNRTALMEVDLFKSSAEMKRVQEKIADRLDVPYSRITTDSVEAAFFLCAYEFAIKSENSPWCELIDETDALVLEYKNDLKQYWKRGYGHDINRKSSCTLFHDIFRRLSEAVNELRTGHVTEVATVQVGHAETLLPLLTLMGFFKDETPLTSSNFPEQERRTFRTSHTVPYAANLVFVLYKCPEGPRLQLLLNEKPLALPNISDPVPLYDIVQEHYRDLLQGCNFQTECELKASTCSKCSEL